MGACKDYANSLKALKEQLKQLRHDKLYLAIQEYVIEEVIEGAEKIKVDSFMMEALCPYNKCRDIVDDVLTKFIETYCEDFDVRHEVDHQASRWSLTFTYKS